LTGELTADDVRQWDPSVLSQLADAAKGLTSAHQSLAEHLDSAARHAQDWHGDAGDAFRAELGRTGADIAADGQQSHRLAAAISGAVDEVSRCRAAIFDLDDTAARYGWTINADWSIDTSNSAVDPDDDDSTAQAYDQLQADLDKVKDNAHATDHELGTSVRAAMGDAGEDDLPGDHPGGGQQVGHDSKQDGPQPGPTPGPKPPEGNTKIGNLGDAIDKSAGEAAQYAGVPKQSTGLGPTQAQLNRAAERASGDLETLSKVGRPLSWLGAGLELQNGANEYGWERDQGKSTASAVRDVAPKTAGKIAGGFAGAAIGGEEGAGIGAAVGSVVPGVGTAVGGVVGAGVGAVVGGLTGSEVGNEMGQAVSKGLHALFGD